MASTFEQYLGARIEEINTAMRRVLAAAVERAPDTDHPMVGRIYRSVSAYIDSGGKRMHGCAVVLAFGAVGGTPPEAILPVAAGIQLYHHHTLVHDDIYDEDAARRGTPTLHSAFTDWFARTRPSDTTVRTRAAGRVFLGAAERLGAIAGWSQGKIVHALAFEAICGASFPPERLLAAVQALNWHDVHDNAGQARDTFHEGTEIPTPERCIEIARLKTGRLFAVSAELAAWLGGGTSSQIQSIVAWIIPTATAYQLQDDLEDLDEGSEKGQGRGIGTDLRSCKPTFILSLALQRASPAGRRLLDAWIRRSAPRTGDVRPVIEAIRDSGALRACRAQVESLVDEALGALATAAPALEPAYVERMGQLTRYFVSDAYWKRPLQLARHPLLPEGG